MHEPVLVSLPSSLDGYRRRRRSTATESSGQEGKEAVETDGQKEEAGGSSLLQLMTIKATKPPLLWLDEARSTASVTAARTEPRWRKDEEGGGRKEEVTVNWKK